MEECKAGWLWNTTITPSGGLPLHQAVSSVNYDVVEYLAKRIKVNLDSQDYSGKTPIMYAAIQGNLEIVNYLAEAGADLEILTTGGESLVMKAASTGSLNVLEWLIKFTNCNLDKKNA